MDGLTMEEAKKKSPQIEPFMIGKKDLAKMLAISTANLERWNASGELGPIGIKKNGRILWILAEIKEWIDARLPRREIWKYTPRAN